MKRGWMSRPFVLALLLCSGLAGAESDDGKGTWDRDQALALSQAAIGRVLTEYTFTAADGRPIKLSDYHGKPLVISLIYTSCYHICPTTTQHLAGVVRHAREVLGEGSFRVVTIGFDTPVDNADAMRMFAAQQSVDIAGWDFLSTDQATLDALATQLGFLYAASPHGFDHLIQASVIDAQGKVYRQVYGMQFDLPKLVEPLKELVFNTPRHESLLSFLGDRIRLFCTVYDPGSNKYKFDYSLFIGMAIGLSTLSLVAFFVIREWRRLRVRGG